MPILPTVSSPISSPSSRSALDGGPVLAPHLIKPNLWLTAQDSDSLVFNSTFPTQVEEWKGAYGSGGTATQVISSQQPIINSNGINGKQTLLFDGIDDFLDTDLTFLASSSYTIFAVERRGALKIANYILGDSSSGINQALHFGYKDNTVFTLDQFGNALDVIVPTFTGGKPTISMGRLDTSSGHSIKYIKESILYTATNSNITPLSSVTNGVIGKGWAGFPPIDNTLYRGNLGEVLIYNRALNLSEINVILNYLSGSWNISIPAGDYNNDYSNDYN